MQSQLYISGKLNANPEFFTTPKGKPWARILLETELNRPEGRGGFQTEIVILPVKCFAREAAAVKDLRPGEEVSIGCHLSATKFETDSGELKRGVQLVADSVLKRLGANAEGR